MAVDDKASDNSGTNILNDGSNPPLSPLHPQGNNSTPSETDISPPQNANDRTLLLSRARSFLLSPQIAGQDLFSKRQFLQEKGLHEAEIDTLLRDTPNHAPSIPPRTYPQPPPSPLPNLLLGLTRVFSWLAGGSALVVFIYYRFLLPRVAQSFMARHSLKKHHLSLMRRLISSVSSFKEFRTETWSVLPKADPWRELSPYSKFFCIDDITKSFGDKDPEYDIVSPVTVLRCGLGDLKKDQSDENSPTTEELFRYLEEKIPWLLSGDGVNYERRLWEVLSSCPLFKATPPLSPPLAGQEVQPPSRWTYIVPLPPDPSPVVKSLASMKLALPKDQASKPSVLQDTLQALSEFTGYISTQVYMPYRPPTSGSGIGSGMGPIDEQLRRDIRALKGLVLNRRSFMPPLTRQSTAATTPP